ATANIVLGNFFGTDTSGANLGNVVGLVVGSASNTIGGASAASGNVFGFNTSSGLLINGAAGTNNLVLGNLFGTNGSGKSLGNVVGLLVQSASNTIGGASAGSGNIFGPNDTAGLEISGAGSTNNLVLGNYFGTDPSNDTFPNQTGML